MPHSIYSPSQKTKLLVHLNRMDPFAIRLLRALLLVHTWSVCSQRQYVVSGSCSDIAHLTIDSMRVYVWMRWYNRKCGVGRHNGDRWRSMRCTVYTVESGCSFLSSESTSSVCLSIRRPYNELLYSEWSWQWLLSRARWTHFTPIAN